MQRRSPRRRCSPLLWASGAPSLTLVSPTASSTCTHSRIGPFISSEGYESTIRLFLYKLLQTLLFDILVCATCAQLLRFANICILGTYCLAHLYTRTTPKANALRGSRGLQGRLSPALRGRSPAPNGSWNGTRGAVASWGSAPKQHATCFRTRAQVLQYTRNSIYTILKYDYNMYTSTLSRTVQIFVSL